MLNENIIEQSLIAQLQEQGYTFFMVQTLRPIVIMPKEKTLLRLF